MKIQFDKGTKLVAINPCTLKFEQCEVVEDWSEGMNGDGPGPKCAFADGAYDVLVSNIDAKKSSELNPIPIKLLVVGYTPNE